MGRGEQGESAGLRIAASADMKNRRCLSHDKRVRGQPGEKNTRAESIMIQGNMPMLNSAAVPR